MERGALKRIGRSNININEQLPRDKDGRGLYQLVNDDPSPWYSDGEFTVSLTGEYKAFLSVGKQGYQEFIVANQGMTCEWETT